MARLLVVDDDPLLRNLLRDIFTSFDHEVDIAEDGAAGLALALEKKPDLVILDIEMPKLNGHQLCALLRKDAVMSKRPILMLTARNDLPDAMQAMGMGADDYITKPFNNAEVVARIDALLLRYSKP